MIDRVSEGVTTRITVCNYDTYQNNRNEIDLSSAMQMNGQGKTKQVTNNKNNKPIKKQTNKSKGFALSQMNESVLIEIKETGEFKGIDVDGEFVKFKDNLEATGRTYKNYKSAFKNWLRQPWVPKSEGLEWLKSKAF
jgi:hypothetical protein